jgi:hypothetical protein
MIKRTITQLLIVGVAILGVGAVLVVADIVALVAHLDTVGMRAGGGLTPDDESWQLLTLIGVGAVIAGVGLLVETAAWIGALVSARRLSDSRWFDRLLWAGIAGAVTMPLFGVGQLIVGNVLLAYVVGGLQPVKGEPPIWPKATILRWSSWGLVPLLGGALFSLLIAGQTNPGAILHGQTWPALMLVTSGLAVAAGGALIEAVAWWAALFNTGRLPDPTWFRVIAWTGGIGLLTLPLLGLGALILAAAGVAYWTAAPDALSVGSSQSDAPLSVQPLR